MICKILAQKVFIAHIANRDGFRIHHQQSLFKYFPPVDA